MRSENVFDKYKTKSYAMTLLMQIPLFYSLFPLT